MVFSLKLRRNRKRKVRGTLVKKDYDYEHAAELSPALKTTTTGVNSVVEKIKQDTFTTGTLAGILGTIVMHILSELWMLTGVTGVTTLEVSSAIFLNPGQFNTPAGLIVGILAHIMVGSAGGVLLAYFIRFSGKDFYWLKGLGLAGFMLLVGMGFIIRMMNIMPEKRDDSMMTMLHFINYFAYGLVVSYIIYKLAEFKKT